MGSNYITQGNMKGGPKQGSFHVPFTKFGLLLKIISLFSFSFVWPENRQTKTSESFLRSNIFPPAPSPTQLNPSNISQGIQDLCNFLRTLKSPLRWTQTSNATKWLVNSTSPAWLPLGTRDFQGVVVPVGVRCPAESFLIDYFTYLGFKGQSLPW